MDAETGFPIDDFSSPMTMEFKVLNLSFSCNRIMWTDTVLTSSHRKNELFKRDVETLGYF